MNAESDVDTERRARADVFAQLVHAELAALKGQMSEQTLAITRMSSDHGLMRESLARIEASISADTALNRERLEWDQGSHERWKAWGVGLAAVLVAVGGGLIGMVEMVRRAWSH